MTAECSTSIREDSAGSSILKEKGREHAYEELTLNVSNSQDFLRKEFSKESAKKSTPSHDHDHDHDHPPPVIENYNSQNEIMDAADARENMLNPDEGEGMY